MARTVNDNPTMDGIASAPRQSKRSFQVPKRLRVAIADSSTETLDMLREMLGGFGHEIVCAATSGEDLIKGCRNHHPDLIISDMEVHCRQEDLIAAVNEICEREPVPVIILSTDYSQTSLDVVKERSVTAHLVKPVTEGNLVASISFSLWHFQVFVEVCREIMSLKQTLEDRKVVERAKGILMDRAATSETQAFRRLQELASSRNMRMTQVADIIVAAEDVFSKSI